MKQKRITFSVLLLGLGINLTHAQYATTSSGGNASGSGGSVSYSIGQVVYTTNTGINGSVAQGVQQPYEISVVMGIEENKGISLVFSAYPNPTTDFLTLKIDGAKINIQSMSFQLFDISGKLLESKKIEGDKTSISMENLASATYFLKLYDMDKEVKIFKVIKN